MFFYENREEITRDWFAVEEEHDFSYPMHLHRWYEIILVIDGELDVVIAEKTYHMEKNDTVFIFPNQPHQLVSSQSSHHKLCLIKPELIAHFNAKVQNCLPYTPIKHITSEPWLELFRSVAADSSLEWMKGILYLYCSFFDHDQFFVISENDMPDNLDLLHRIFRFAAEHYTERCSLSDLSAHIGYDYSYLSKLFSERIGVSFTEYVNMLRIDRACYYLKNSELPILEISEHCGYGSLRSFNRNFVKRTGMTPRDYKRSSEQYHEHHG